MRAEIRAKEEALKRAAVRKAKEERKQKNRCRINEMIKKCIRKRTEKAGVKMKRFIDFMAIFPHLCYAITNVRKGGAVLYAGKQG